jgi:hypothetical protein
MISTPNKEKREKRPKPKKPKLKITMLLLEKKKMNQRNTRNKWLCSFSVMITQSENSLESSANTPTLLDSSIT